MKLSNVLKKVALIGFIFVLAITLNTGVAEAKKVRWKMQSTWGSKLPHLGTSGPRFSNDVKVMSAGSLIIKFFEPNALVPALECFDSISKGALDAAWTTPGYSVGKIPALSFFTAVPFGPGFGEMMAWQWFGGGLDIKNDLYAPHNLIALPNLAIGPETSGWFKKEIKSVEELKGMKMRFFGLGAKVMQKMGVSTQLLAGGDIYPALEKGVIDATEFSMPAMDISYGFYQIAKYNYFPGWHQQTSISELMMNKKAFEGLSDQHRRIIEVALGHQVAWTYAESEANNFVAMREMADKHGVIIKRWPDSTLALFEQAWVDVVKEESAKDPVFKRVAESYYAFRAKYKIWKDAQTLKGTYLGK